MTDSKTLPASDIEGRIRAAYESLRAGRCTKGQFADNVIDALQSLSPAIPTELEEVREALIHARNTFYRYAKLHRAKATDEGDRKACDNASMGEEMSRALEKLAALTLPTTASTPMPMLISRETLRRKIETDPDDEPGAAGSGLSSDPAIREAALREAAAAICLECKIGVPPTSHGLHEYADKRTSSCRAHAILSLIEDKSVE